MKMLKMKWVCALAMLAAACGGGQADDPRSPLSDAKAPEARAEPASNRMELRLVGTNGGAVSSVLLGIRDIRVTYAGSELPVDVAKDPMELAQAQQAWLAGTFEAPEGAEAVQVSVYLDDYGGFMGAEGSGEIDARGLPIRFEAPLKSLRASGRAVVHLDLARSLMAAGDERKVLLPQYRVSY